MDALKVLLVDDEEEFVSALAERLQLRGFEALSATDGQEALRIIEGQQPRVVVLDVLMPGLGGLEVLQLIKRADPRVQVILLTGRGAANGGAETMPPGAFACLMKPVRIEELIQKIREAAEGPGKAPS